MSVMLMHTHTPRVLMFTRWNDDACTMSRWSSCVINLVHIIHPYVAIRYVLSGWEIMLLNMSKDRQSNKSWRVFMCVFLGHHFETMFEIKREKLRITIVRRHVRSCMNYMFINLNIIVYIWLKRIFLSFDLKTNYSVGVTKKTEFSKQSQKRL